jgi:hypothetical protein
MMQVILTPLLMLRIRLRQEIYLQKDFLASPSLSIPPDKISGNFDEKFQEQDISLKRVRNTTRLVYSTGIAHKLAAQYQIPAAELARKIAIAVSEATVNCQENQVFLPLLEPALQDVAVRATDSGLVQFELSDRAIAAWLDLLVQHFSHLSQIQLSQEKKRFKTHKSRDPDKTRSDTDGSVPFLTSPSSCSFVPAPSLTAAEIFTLQHTHARCCSLLRLAHQEGLVALSRDQFPSNWRFTMPALIPWLTPEMQLLLNHPAERQLISQLFVALDAIPSLSPACPKIVLRLAQEVSQAFQAFYSAHPIWGSFKKSSKLAQARLGLVMASQRIIYLLVEDLLNISVPLEL